MFTTRLGFIEVIVKGRLPLTVILLNSSVPSFRHLRFGDDTSGSTNKDLLSMPNSGRDGCTGGSGRQSGVSMMRILLIFVAFATFASAQQWSTLPADVLVSMNTSSPGTAITTSIGNGGTVCGSNCTVGSTLSWNGGWTGSSPQDFTVAANQGACSNLGPVQMNGGSLYPAQTLNYYSAAHNDADNNTNAGLGFSGTPGGATVVAALACITLGPPTQDNGSDWDIFALASSSGNYYMAQLNPACPGSGEYGIRMEVKPTAHSACIAIPPQTTIWVALACNFTTGYGAMWVYTAGGSLIGTVSITAGDTGGTLDFISFGNNEAGNNSGTSTYFQNLMVNFSSASHPPLCSGPMIRWLPACLPRTVSASGHPA